MLEKVWGPAHCSPFGPCSLPKPPLLVWYRTSSRMIGLLFGLAPYHSAKVAADSMQAPPPLASTGFPSGLSVVCTMPLVRVPQPIPKSGWLSLKSRKMTGTRRMHRPSFISQECAVVQVKPGSRVQVEEHPSPLLLFPSSHCSLRTRPS